MAVDMHSKFDASHTLQCSSINNIDIRKNKRRCPRSLLSQAQVTCKSTVMNLYSSQSRLRWTLTAARRRRCWSARFPKTHHHISCFLVRRLIEWRSLSCLGSVCPVTSSGQITSMLLFPVQRHFLKQLKRAGVPVRDLLHFYTAIVRPVLEYACSVWHSGLTAGQCNAIENIQKRAIRVVYSDTDCDCEIALTVAGMDSLKDRREMLINFKNWTSV